MIVALWAGSRRCVDLERANGRCWTRSCISGARPRRRNKTQAGERDFHGELLVVEVDGGHGRAARDADGLRVGIPRLGAAVTELRAASPERARRFEGRRWLVRPLLMELGRRRPVDGLPLRRRVVRDGVLVALHLALSVRDRSPWPREREALAISSGDARRAVATPRRAEEHPHTEQQGHDSRTRRTWRPRTSTAPRGPSTCSPRRTGTSPRRCARPPRTGSRCARTR